MRVEMFAVILGLFLAVPFFYWLGDRFASRTR
jgi:hypothetical protein